MNKAEEKALKEKNKKRNKTLIKLGCLMALLQLVISVVFIVLLHFLDILPNLYKVLISVLLILFCLVTFITQYWKKIGIATKILSFLMCVIMVVGGVYIYNTYLAINKISGVNTQKTTMGVFVLADRDYETIQDVQSLSFGIVNNIDRNNTDNAIAYINKELGTEITVTEYESLPALVDALYSGLTETIILNTSYLNVLTEMESYEDFETRTKMIFSYEQEYTVKTDKNEEYLSGEGIFTIYISGIDTNGVPTENRNSDVNIICTVNTNTHQILMINTPRDFFIPLSISGGVNDKLTHAGCYGIDCSVDTLEMLYGINIDYYLKVNFTGFVDIIDAMGGVDVYSEYTFVTRHGNDQIVEGINHLTGIQALGFARERYSFGTGDRQRGKNQMAVINAVIKKLTTTDTLKNYNGILAAVSESMVTNMSYDMISDLVKMQLEEMPSWDIKTYSVDGTGDNQPTYSLSSPNYVMVPNEDTVNQAKDYLTRMHNGEIIEIIQ